MPTPMWHFSSASKKWALRFSTGGQRVCLRWRLSQQPYLSTAGGRATHPLHRVCSGTGRSPQRTACLPTRHWWKPSPPAPRPRTILTTFSGWVAVPWRSPSPGEDLQSPNGGVASPSLLIRLESGVPGHAAWQAVYPGGQRGSTSLQAHALFGGCVNVWIQSRSWFAEGFETPPSRSPGGWVSRRYSSCDVMGRELGLPLPLAFARSQPPCGPHILIKEMALDPPRCFWLSRSSTEEDRR